MKVKKLLAVLCTVVALALGFAFAACDNGKDPEPAAKTYTVTFDANGGELNGNATVKVEENKTISGAPTASKTDYDFSGWYTLATDGDKIDLGTYKVTKDVTLYAHYTEKETPPAPAEKIEITFNANGGKIDGKDTAKVEAGKDGVIPKAPAVTRDGYRLDGWYDAAENGNKVRPLFDKVTENTTIYAHWVKQYTVTFDANGGELVGVDKLTVDEGGNLTGVPSASKSGDEFHGWYTEAEGGDKVNFDTYTVTENATLYAHFGVITMPVKTLKSHEGNKVGYRIEAEEAKITGTQSSENSAGTGFIENNIATASGKTSIGYLGVKGNTVTFTFKSETAGKATISLRATSNAVQMPADGNWANMYVADQTVSTKDFTVKFNDNAVNFQPATLRGAGPEKPMTWNLYWDPISFGELDIEAGINSLVITVADTTVPNMDCLDIETTLNITSANGDAVSGEETLPAPPAPDVNYDKNVEVALVIGGYEGGPAVEKAILGFTENIPATAIATGNPFTVSWGGKLGRTGDKVYLCDENGEKLAESATESAYVAIEYAVTYGQWSFNGNLSPFTYNQQIAKNLWKDLNTVTIAIDSLTIGTETYTKFTGTVTADKEIPCLADWKVDGTFSDSITWNDAERTINLMYGAYEPEALKNDNGKNPLIIWLHGGGEGGTDPTIAILGNQVTGLSNEGIQKYFKNDTLAGAYVLAPQSPTQWMDIGDGAQASSPENSVYTESLFKLIKQYAETINTDIDLNRIYIGGCSNGGWMTLELLADHGEYFAAAYPVSACYDTQYITDAMIEKLKDIPIWFTHSKNDGTLPIAEKKQGANWWEPVTYGNLLEQNTNELYLKLVNAGSTSVYYSLFENVTVGTTNYDGHWSWIYALRDECVNVQTHTGTGTDGALLIGDLNPASTEKVQINDADVTMWGWIAAQAKTPAQA